MHFFSTLLVAVATALTVSGAATTTQTNASSDVSLTLNKGNHYGAPIPPWESGCSPGWYYGDHPDYLVISLIWLKDSVSFTNMLSRTNSDQYLYRLSARS